MLQSLAARLVSQITGRFCRNVDTKDLSISVARGEISLRNVELNASAFDELALPVTIERGAVGSIRIKVAWTRLASSPIEVTIDEVSVVACLNTRAAADAHRGEEDQRVARRAMLAAQMEEQRGQLLSAGVQDSGSASMTQRIINNLILTISNVDVRFEHRTSDKSAPVAFGVRLNMLSVLSTDSERKPVHFSTDSDIYKELKVSDLHVYHDASHAREASPQTLLVQPVVATAWLTLTGTSARVAGDDSPRMSLKVDVQPVRVALTLDAACDAGVIAGALAAGRPSGPLPKQRPAMAYKDHYKEWWKYAIAQAIALVRKRREELGWERMRKHVRLALRYKQLYRRALGVLPLETLTEEEQDELVAIHDSVALDFLKLVRQITVDGMRAEVSDMLKQSVAPPPQARGFFGRLFSREKKTVTVGGVDVEVTQEDLEKMQTWMGTASDWDGAAADHASKDTLITVSMTTLDVEILGGAGGPAGRTGSAEGGEGRLFKSLLGACTMSLLQQHDGFVARMSVRSLVVQGLQRQRNILDRTGMPDGSELAAQGAEENVLEMAVEKAPATGEADLLVQGQVLPVCVCLEGETARAIMGWIEAVQLRVASAAALAQKAGTRMSAAAKSGLIQAGEFARLYASPDLFVKLSLRLHAPTIMMLCPPEAVGEDLPPSLLAVNLGSLAIESSRVGDTQRYTWSLSNVNASACSPGGAWRDTQHALFSRDLSATLTVDKPSSDRPEMVVCADLGSIDMRITQMHVLHAMACGQTIATIFGSPSDAKPQSKKRLQSRSLAQHEVALEKKEVRSKLAREAAREASDTSAPCASPQSTSMSVKTSNSSQVMTGVGVGSNGTDAGKTRAGDLSTRDEATAVRSGEKTTAVTLTLRSFVLRLEAVSSPSLQAEATWAPTCNPPNSIEMQVDKLEVCMHAWATREKVIKASLRSVVVRHLEQKTTDERFALNVIAPQRYSGSVRYLHRLAAHLEEAFKLHDKDGTGDLSLDEMKNILGAASNEGGFGLRVPENQIHMMCSKLDRDQNGRLDIQEFIQLAAFLCSRVPGDPRASVFHVPLTSEIPTDERPFLTCEIDHSVAANNKGELNTKVFVCRFEVQVARSPVQNIIDWLNVFSYPHQNLTDQKQRAEAEKTSSASSAFAGITALRASFEIDRDDESDVWIPPACNRRMCVEMEEIDVVVHDSLVSPACFHFRGGPINLVRSERIPSDDSSAFAASTKLDLESMEVLYASDKLDMDWDLQAILARTSFHLRSRMSMPRGEIQITREDELNVGHGGLVLEVSGRHLLFLKALQHIYDGVGDACAELSKEASGTALSRQAVSKSFSLKGGGVGTAGTASQRALLRHRGSISSHKSHGRERQKRHRNLHALTRTFNCSNMMFCLVDDLECISEPDKAKRTTILRLRLEQTIARESFHLGEEFANLQASTCMSIGASALENDSQTTFLRQKEPEDGMETLMEPWTCVLKVSTSTTSAMQQISFWSEDTAEVTVSPDHIQRPLTALNKFEGHVRQQNLLLMRLQERAKVRHCLRPEPVAAALDQKFAIFLANLNQDEKREIRNRTDMAILVRVYDPHRCDTVSDTPLTQVVLRPQQTIALPRRVLGSGVLMIQPSRAMPAASGQIAWAMGRWSRVEDLSISKPVDPSLQMEHEFAQEYAWRKNCSLSGVAATSIETEFEFSMPLVLQLIMKSKKLDEILNDKECQSEFKTSLSHAVQHGRACVKHVDVLNLRQSGPEVLDLHFMVKLCARTHSGGLVFDSVNEFVHERLALSLVKEGIITEIHDLSVIREPAFERFVACTSPQMPNTHFFMSSGVRGIEIAAPLTLLNVLPFPATVNFFSSEEAKESVAMVRLEPGQKKLQYELLSPKTSIFLQVEFGDYVSQKCPVFRTAEMVRRAWPMISRTGQAALSCMVEMSSSVEFVVAFYMSMVVVNRTGLALSFGCCRPRQGADKVRSNAGKTEQSELEVMIQKDFDSSSTQVADLNDSKRSKIFVQDGEDWILRYEGEDSPQTWNKREAEIVLLHLTPGGSWGPCIKMQGTDSWIPLTGDGTVDGNDQTLFWTQITGPPASAQGPDNIQFAYNLGGCMRHGIPPFDRTVYVTLTPRFTFLNQTGLELQITSIERDAELSGNIYGQVRDGESLSTLGLFPATGGKKQETTGGRGLQRGLSFTQNMMSGLEKRLSFTGSAETVERAESKKLRIRLLSSDGVPVTQLSEPFSIQDQRSIALRLLRHVGDDSEVHQHAAAQNAIQVRVTVSNWEAATFVEVVSVDFEEPMFQIRNMCSSNENIISIWQNASRLGEAGAMFVNAGETVPFAFDAPDAGAEVSFRVNDGNLVTLNLKHPQQHGYIETKRGSRVLGQNSEVKVKYATSILGHTRMLRLFEACTLQPSWEENVSIELMRGSVSLRGISFSMLAVDRSELLFASIQGISALNTITHNLSTTTIAVQKMQIDNQTSSGPEVAMLADVSDSKFAQIELRKNLQVTAMPYFDCVKVNISPITVQMHEVWLRHMLQFEIDAVGDIADAKAAELEVNEDMKYIRRAQIGQPKDSEETLETLSFLGKGITLRQQFFQELDLCGFTAQVTLSGLSAVPLRNAVQARVGPVSKMYGFIHELGQKVSIPEINGTPVTLPNYHKEDLALNAGSGGLTSIIAQHYKHAIITAGLKILTSGAALCGLLMTAGDSKEEQLKRMEAQSSRHDSTGALDGVGKGILDGLSGVVTKPLDGAKEGGLFGFLEGLGAGTVGAIVKPIGGVVGATQSMVNAFDQPKSFSRTRVPRAVFGDRILRKFDAENARAYQDLCKRESSLRRTQTQKSWRNNDEADRLFKLKQGYLGFVKTGADSMLNEGLFVSFDAVVLVRRKDMMVQEDIPMSAITDVSLTEDSMMIKSGVRSTALELRVQEGHAKCAKMRQVILQQVELAKQKERMIASADQGEAMTLSDASACRVDRAGAEVNPPTLGLYERENGSSNKNPVPDPILNLWRGLDFAGGEVDRAQHFAGSGLATADDCDDGEEVSRGLRQRGLESHANWPHRTMSGVIPTMKIESLAMSQTTVSQLYPSSRGRCLYAKVLGAPVMGVRTCVQTGQQVSAADVLLGDETGCVYLTATGPHLALLQPGKSVVIRNFRVRTLRNHLRLFLDRWGSIGELQPGLTCEVNELNNRSCVEFIQIKGDSDSSMSTEGK